MDRFFVLRGFFLNGQGRLEAKDLPSLQRLGRGLSGFVYETTWEGNRYARKDFPIGAHHLIFQKEARLLLGINHPNIVKCYGYTLGQSSCSLLQEFVDDNIQDAIRRRIEAQMKSAPPSSDEASSSEMPRSRRIVPFEESEAVAITSQIASGMQYLHEQGVAHGDLKPRNLLAYLNSDACEMIVKVADFGFVQTKRQIKLASKRARQYDGLMWKAPELFDELQLDLFDPDNSDKDLDDFDDDEVQEEVKGKGSETAVTFLKSRLAMADVYSFGLTCSHILGGRLWSPELSLFELREQRRKEFIPDLSSFICPDYLKFIIGLCLEVTPSKRPTFSTICSMIELYRSFPQLFSVMKGAMERDMTKGYGFEDMLSTVTTLHLKDCYEDSSGELYELTCLPHGIGKLKALETLDVSGCSNLEELPKEIENLTSLTSLILSECSKLKGLSLSILKSVPLKTLDVRGCSNLDQFYEEIGNMTTLTRVKGLLHGTWKLIPNWVGFLRKMCDINLEKIGIQSLLGLPREINSLEVLNMKGCGKLTSLPHSFGSFKKLQDLNLEGSGIQSLPESFGELSSLEVLNMKNCGKLTSLPHSFGSLKKLRDLNLEESGIQSLPELFGELSSLEVLNMKGCGKLISLPCSYGSLKKLRDLNLEESGIRTLPKSFGELRSLKVLNMKGCSKLISLPHSFGSLKKLRDLNLEKSGIQSLPKSFGKLSSLEVLNIKGCSKLTSPPHSFGSLMMLQDFDLEAVARPLKEVASGGVQALGFTQMARKLQGFANLIKCTKCPGGKLEVAKAGAIAEAIKLAKAEDGQYVRQAMKLLEALTSSRGGVPLGSERDDIFIEVSDHVEVLIELMKASRHPAARLLAAETVVNILVNQSVWQTVRSQYDIVSALVAISNEHPANRSMKEQNRADRLCLIGLSRLMELSNGVNLKINSPDDKTQIVVTILMKLLREGLMDDGEANLAKDSLVALDTHVLDSTPTKEVSLLIRKHIAELMKTKAFTAHSSVPGRMAIVSIMTKLCAVYKEDITEDLFSYVLDVIRSAGIEISDSGDPEQKEALAKLLSLSVKLLCFCVFHGKDMAHSVLSKNTGERATLEKLFNEPDSGISHESRLEIMDVLDQISELSSHPPTVIEQLAKLVKMFNSSPAACQPQVATRILNCVMKLQDEADAFEIEKTGVLDALMGLLKEGNQDCQQDAVLALYILSPHISIQTSELPCQSILYFLRSTRPKVREAAVGLLDLMVAKEVVDGKMFMETPGALKYTLGMLKNPLPEGHEGSESKTSQGGASALLKLATEDGDDSVRLGILNDGLDVLLKYVQKSGIDKFKEMLATMLSLICTTGNGPNLEAVTEGGGHIFLVTCLRENISKEAAARGVLSLIRGTAKSRTNVLKADFVTVAVDSVEQRFASTDIALALADIFATSEELEHIYASKMGAQALLVLLEHCPELEGKGAAAAVIAKLYPRLNRAADDQRQTELTGACSHLLKYLELEDKSQLKMFLRALAAFATGKKGRQMIHEERGHKPLIKYLKNNDSDIEVQGLMLKILVEMSCVFTEVGERRDSSHHKIMNLFLEQKISELLLILPASGEFDKHTENMKNLLILIRNFSMAGQAAVSQLSEYHAVTVLLKVLKQHEHVNPVSVLTELAVKALEKFMDEPNGKQAFMREGGISSLVAVLKLQASRGSDVKSFTTIILSTVAKDPDTRRAACDAIFYSDKYLVLRLNDIMCDGETSRVKWQAAVLLKLLAMYGPQSKVCSAMVSSGSLEVLNTLRDVQHCKEVRDMANDVLKYVRAQSRECKKVIDSWDRGLFR